MGRGKGGGGRGSRREGWEEREGGEGEEEKGSRARLQLEPMLIRSAAAQKGSLRKRWQLSEGPLQLPTVGDEHHHAQDPKREKGGHEPRGGENTGHL